MTQPAALIGKVLDQKYRIEAMIGEGGMGAVFRATHIGTKRPVALKVIAPRLVTSPEIVERFKREAEAAGRLIHPNVINVTDFGFAATPEGPLAYLVMEFLEGSTLADVLDEEKQLSLEWTLDIVEQICAGLSEAHRRGIVHRDLKPENIWLEPSRRGGYTVKVLDFGIADLLAPAAVPQASSLPSLSQVGSLDPTVPSPAVVPQASSLPPSVTPSSSLPEADPTSTTQTAALNANTPPTVLRPDTDQHRTSTSQWDTAYLAKPASSNITARGTLLGTPAYMSPEQCRGEELDVRSDVYSLGVIVYRMLAGRPVFKGNIGELVRQHVKEPPPPLKCRGVPRKVAAVVMAALSKDPAKRPAGADAFANGLRANSEGLFVLLRRAIAIYAEHLPLFLKLSLAVFFAPILIHAAWVIHEAQLVPPTVTPAQRMVVEAAWVAAAFVADFIALTAVSGLTAVAVLFLRVTPQRRLTAEVILSLLRQRWRPFLGATFGLMWRMLLGLVCFVIPWIALYFRSLLFAPVIMLDGLNCRGALQRCKQLNRRDVRTVFLLAMLQLVASGAIQDLCREFYHPRGGVGLHGDLLAGAAGVFGLYLFVFVPLLSIVKALFYLKLCQLGGETEEDTVHALATGLFPPARWQSHSHDQPPPSNAAERQ